MKVDPALLQPGMVVVWDGVYHGSHYVVKEICGREATIESWNPESSVGLTVWNAEIARMHWPKCHCGAELVGVDSIPSPDPYADDIHGDDTPVLQCPGCHESSAWDI